MTHNDGVVLKIGALGSIESPRLAFTHLTVAQLIDWSYNCIGTGEIGMSYVTRPDQQTTQHATGLANFQRYN